jgi:hypothetical protein
MTGLHTCRLVTRCLPSDGWSLGACQLVSGCCVVEMPLPYPLVSFLVASQLPTSGGAIGMGTSHPANGLVMPDAALCPGKAPTIYFPGYCLK